MPDFFSRPRKLLLFSILIVALAIAVLVNRPAASHQATAAIPAATAIVLQCTDLQAAVQSIQSPFLNAAWKNILQNTPLATALEEAAAVDELLQNDSLTKYAFTRQTLYAAFSGAETDKMDALFIVDLENQQQIDKTLIFNKLTQNTTAYSFRGDPIFSVLTGAHKGLSFCFKDNLLLFARRPVLVEDALLQLRERENEWADLPVAQQPCCITIRTTVFAQQLAPNFGQLTDVLARNMESLTVQWDLQGKVTAQVTPKGFLQHVLQKKAGGSADPLCSVLPANTALLAWVGLAQRGDFADLFKATQNSDFEDYVLPWLGSEAAFIVTDPVSTGLQQDQFFALSVQDTALAREKMQAFGAATGVLKHYDYQTFEVTQFVRNTLLQPLAGEAAAFRNPAYTLLGNYVIWGATADALEKLIDQYIVNQTLLNSTAMLQMRNDWPEEQSQSALLLFNSAYLPRMLEEVFAGNRPLGSPVVWEHIAKTGLLAAHFKQNQSVADVLLSSQPGDVAPEAPGIIWKKMLVADVASAPFVVTSPAQPGQYAVLIQDKQNQLYCFDTQGNLRWRRNLGGPLLSAVYNTTAPDSHAGSYLCNTAERVWLFDEAGNNVPGFPVVLQSPATNGLIPVYFDNNTPFHYFLVCANGNAYGYDAYGRPLSGWNPQSGVGLVRQPMAHFQRDGKDFLALVNTAGTLSVFGRDGTLRFPPRQLSGQSFSAPQVDAVSTTPRIVVANERGQFFVCNLAGEIFSLQLGKPANTIHPGVFAPFSDEQHFIYAVLEEANITVGGYKGQVFRPLFSTALSAAADTLFAVEGGQLGALARDKRQIFLFDPLGQIIPTFPLAGSTPFVISRLGGDKPVLVVGFERSIYMYKL